MTRCPLLGGCATAVGRRDAETCSIRCSLCSRLVSHPSASVQWGILGGWGADNGGVGWASPPGPLSTMWRGGVGRTYRLADSGARLSLYLSRSAGAGMHGGGAG